MLSAKEALVRDGIIEKVGRGRISGAGHSHLHTLYSGGERFKDWPKGEVTVSEPTADKAAEVKVVRSAGTSGAKTVAELPEYRYTEDAFQAVHFVNGKKVVRSLRSACNGCGYSLVVCWCPEPRIVALDGRGSVKVTIEPIKGV